VNTEDSSDYQDGIGPTREQNRSERRKQIRRAQPPAHTDEEIRQWWRDIGGDFFGPKIEHVCMPEEKFLTAMRTLFDSFDHTREQLAAALQEKESRKCPYPEENDSTDGACPAWWRGNDDGVRGTTERIKKELTRDLSVRVSGVVGYAPLQEVLDAIADMRRALFNARCLLEEKFDG